MDYRPEQNQPAQRSLELNKLNGMLESTISPGGLIGDSADMQSIHSLIGKATNHSFPVVILGETGTGKELVARSIHYSGSRKNSPFVPVDCSSLAPSLIESELFGYVRGAFTGAVTDKKGLFETADTGTLFLDEIGELHRDLQAKLLRAIQEHEVRPVGSTKTKSVDVRIVAATHRDLKHAAAEGSFREDLYYRLNVFSVTMPPLRERKGDIPLLIAAFLIKHADPTREITSVGKAFWAAAMSHDWPGNVRELENFVERCIALGSGSILEDEEQCLKWTGEGHPDSATLYAENEHMEPLHVLEQRMIYKVLGETSGNKFETARILGIGKTTLYRKLKEYELDSSFPKQIIAES
jgi:two-component system, NtrC family, response regulator AtoC